MCLSGCCVPWWELLFREAPIASLEWHTARGREVSVREANFAVHLPRLGHVFA